MIEQTEFSKIDRNVQFYRIAYIIENGAPYNIQKLNYCQKASKKFSKFLYNNEFTVNYLANPELSEYQQMEEHLLKLGNDYSDKNVTSHLIICIYYVGYAVINNSEVKQFANKGEMYHLDSLVNQLRKFQKTTIFSFCDFFNLKVDCPFPKFLENNCDGSYYILRTSVKAQNPQNYEDSATFKFLELYKQYQQFSMENLASDFLVIYQESENIQISWKSDEGKNSKNFIPINSKQYIKQLQEKYKRELINQKLMKIQYFLKMKLKELHKLREFLRNEYSLYITNKTKNDYDVSINAQEKQKISREDLFKYISYEEMTQNLCIVMKDQEIKKTNLQDIQIII